MYIGNQKILQETTLGDGYVEVTLESEELGLDGKESVVFQKDILEKLKTRKENSDYTKLRTIRCEKPIQGIVATLLAYAVPIDDMEHIFQNTILTLKNAEALHNRKLKGSHEDHQNVYQLKNELLG